MCKVGPAYLPNPDHGAEERNAALLPCLEEIQLVHERGILIRRRLPGV